MLVLSRTIGSGIILGDDIVIEVVAISGNQVKLGIRAPRAVEVWRSELRPIPDIGPDIGPDDIIIRAPRSSTVFEWPD